MAADLRALSALHLSIAELLVSLAATPTARLTEVILELLEEAEHLSTCPEVYHGSLRAFRESAHGEGRVSSRSLKLTLALVTHPLDHPFA